MIKWQEKLQSKYNCLQQELNSSLARKRPSPEYLKSVTHSKLQSIWIQQERLHQTCVNDIIAIRKIQKDVSKVNEKISITAAHLKAIINERLKFYKADLLGALDFDRISSGQIGDQDFSLKLLAQSQYNRILFKLAGNSIEMQYCHEYFFDSLQLFK